MSLRLTLAIVASLALHLVLLIAHAPMPPRPAPPLQVALPPLSLPEPVVDMLPADLDKKPPALEHDTLTPPPAEAPKPPPPSTPPPATAKPGRLSAKAEQRALQKLAEFLVYPEAAINAGHEGTAHLLLRLGPDGRILTASLAASSGHPSLDHAALSAVLRAGRLNTGGKTEFILPFTFRLQ